MRLSAQGSPSRCGLKLSERSAPILRKDQSQNAQEDRFVFVERHILHKRLPLVLATLIRPFGFNNDSENVIFIFPSYFHSAVFTVT